MHTAGEQRLNGALAQIERLKAQGAPQRLISDLLGVTAQIQDHIRAEAAKHASLNSRLLELSPMIMFVLNAKERSNTYFSPNVDRVLGYSAAELVDMGPKFYSDLYDTSYIPDSIPNRKALSALEDGAHDTKTIRLKHKNGNWVYLRRTVVVFDRDSDGRPINFLGTCEDVSAQVKQEEELLGQKLLLESIVENIPVAVILKDATDDFRVTLWNKAAEEIFEAPRAAVIGKTMQELSSKNDEFKLLENRDQAANPEKQAEVETQFKTENRGVAEIRSRQFPLALGGSANARYVLDLCEDITRKKRSQQRLMQSAKMSSLGEMAGGIAHEINNPLAIIQGKAEQMRKRIETQAVDLEYFKKNLGQIEKTVERIAKIIKGLRSFSRNAEADPMAEVKVSQIVEDTLELCGERFKNRAIDLRVNSADGLSIECRPSQISQVVLNLLSNAYDAVENSAEKWVQLEVASDGDLVKISVADSGSGIEPGALERIMEPFFTTKAVGRGTGLGLSIAKGICEDHNGCLRYDPLSKHTRFVIELPRRQPAPAAIFRAAS
jgi:PAS domain S-box-containing protein